MRKRQLTTTTFERFMKLSSFTRGNKRFPTNKEVREMFDLSEGASYKLIYSYKKQLTHCPVCNSERKSENKPWWEIFKFKSKLI